MNAVSIIPVGTVTFLFTDLEGSTRSWEQQGRAMSAALARHDAIVRSACAGNNGYVFKTLGDAFCVAFGAAHDALAAAIDLQLGLLAEDWQAIGMGSPLLLRLALHTGPVETRDGDYFGPTLNRTSRLLATAHGGQSLLSEVTAMMVREHLLGNMALKGLGEHRLKDLQRPESVYQLVCPPLPVDFPPLRSLEGRPHNLPLQLTLFVGRETALADAATRLRDPGTRLLTLLGPGGTGKTRISLQLAAECLHDFRDGAFFVALAPVRDALQVALSIMSDLGLQSPAGRDPVDALVEYLHGKHQLLVLDNFEQVMDSASLVGDLLRGCPDLKVVVTSREALRIGGEKVVAIPPLELPSLAKLPDARQLVQFESVRLFIDRAMSVKADFAVTNANAPAVAEICHRLDGLPLAIELAAARIRMFDAETLLARMSRGVAATLTGGSRDLTARQQTLRGAIVWSVDLLTKDERTLFARLGIFFGSFTYEAAEAVGSDADTPGMVGDADVLTALEGLLDKSLLRRQDLPGGPSRFRMLETIREHASGLASSTGEADASRDRHLLHYTLEAEEIEPHLSGADQDVWYDRLDVERDNLREALERASSAPVTGARADLGIRLCVATVDYWQFRGDYLIPVPLLGSILEAVDPMMPGSTAMEAPEPGAAGPGVPERTLAYGRWAYPHLARDLPRDDHKPMLEAAYEAFSAMGDVRGQGRVLERLANVHAGTGSDAEVVIGYSTQAMEAFRRVGDHRSEIDASVRLAMTESGRGDMARAREIIAQSILVARRHQDSNGLRLMRMMRVYLDFKCGDIAAASLHFGDGADGAGLLGSMGGEVLDGYFAVYRGDLGVAQAAMEGLHSSSRQKMFLAPLVFRLSADLASARTALDRLRIELVTNDQWDGLCDVMVCLAVLASAAGDRQAACVHLREAIRIRARAPFLSKLPFVILEVAGLTASVDPARAARLASLSRGLTARGERWPVYPQDVEQIRAILLAHGADPDLAYPDPMPGEAEVVSEALAALEFVK